MNSSRAQSGWSTGTGPATGLVDIWSAGSGLGHADRPLCARELWRSR